MVLNLLKINKSLLFNHHNNYDIIHCIMFQIINLILELNVSHAMLWTCILCLSMVLHLWIDQLDIIPMMLISQFQILITIQDMMEFQINMHYSPMISRFSRLKDWSLDITFCPTGTLLLETIPWQCLLQGTLLEYFSLH